MNYNNILPLITLDSYTRNIKGKILYSIRKLQNFYFIRVYALGSNSIPII